MNELDDMFQKQAATDSALDIVTRYFVRCSNWPKEEVGRNGLADSLIEACQKTGVDPVKLCQRCAEMSEYCPTNFDLLNVAREMEAEMRRAAEPEEERKKTEQWKKLYGDPAPFVDEADFWETAKKNISAREAMEKRILEELKKVNPKYKDRQNIDYSTWFRMQAQLGYTLTPEQRK